MASGNAIGSGLDLKSIGTTVSGLSTSVSTQNLTTGQTFALGAINHFTGNKTLSNNSLTQFASISNSAGGNFASAAVSGRIRIYYSVVQFGNSGIVGNAQSGVQDITFAFATPGTTGVVSPNPGNSILSSSANTLVHTETSGTNTATFTITLPVVATPTIIFSATVNSSLTPVAGTIPLGIEVAWDLEISGAQSAFSYSAL